MSLVLALALLRTVFHGRIIRDLTRGRGFREHSSRRMEGSMTGHRDLRARACALVVALLVSGAAGSRRRWPGLQRRHRRLRVGLPDLALWHQRQRVALGRRLQREHRLQHGRPVQRRHGNPGGCAGRTRPNSIRSTTPDRSPSHTTGRTASITRPSTIVRPILDKSPRHRGLCGEPGRWHQQLRDRPGRPLHQYQLPGGCRMDLERHQLRSSAPTARTPRSRGPRRIASTMPDRPSATSRIQAASTTAISRRARPSRSSTTPGLMATRPPKESTISG